MFSRWTVARVARVARVNQSRESRESRESRSLTIGTVESALTSCEGRYSCGVCADVNARPTCAHKIRRQVSHCFVVASYRDEIIVWQKVQTHSMRNCEASVVQHEVDGTLALIAGHAYMKSRIVCSKKHHGVKAYIQMSRGQRQSKSHSRETFGRKCDEVSRNRL
jgi:hypothetical protein